MFDDIMNKIVLDVTRQKDKIIESVLIKYNLGIEEAKKRIRIERSMLNSEEIIYLDNERIGEMVVVVEDCRVTIKFVEEE